MSVIPYNPCPQCGRLKSYVYQLCEECFVKKDKTVYPDGNPKAQAAVGKATIHAVPFTALDELGAAMLDGQKKYGLVNWRKSGQGVSASTYIDAVYRHLKAWVGGERVAADSGVHHMGHVMACAAIIIDAEAVGQLIDDRQGNPEAVGTKPGDLARK